MVVPLLVVVLPLVLPLGSVTVSVVVRMVVVVVKSSVGAVPVAGETVFCVAPDEPEYPLLLSVSVVEPDAGGLGI